MGCCQSTEQVEEKRKDQEISAQIVRDRANMRKEIKMLLLGKIYSSSFTYKVLIYSHRCW
jgi:hypothetical protein